jgi:pimeloyl-ACP methyl ester carboxylesterase
VPTVCAYFTTTIAMADLDAVRRELGVERINLIGASYGTRAALEYQRLHPEAVRRSVLDGVAPPDMALPASFSTDAQAAFDAVLDGCERDAACAKAHPRLRANWRTLLAGLPRAAMLPDALSGAPERIEITRAVVLGALRGPLYAPALAAALPTAIDAAAEGRYEPLVGLAALLSSRKGASGLWACTSRSGHARDLPRPASTVAMAGADFGRDFGPPLRDASVPTGPRGEGADRFYAIAAEPIAVLLLSGGLDPADAQPRHAAPGCDALGRSARAVGRPERGHGVMGLGCMRQVISLRRRRLTDAGGSRGRLQLRHRASAGRPHSGRRPASRQRACDRGQPGSAKSFQAPGVRPLRNGSDAHPRKARVQAVADIGFSAPNGSITGLLGRTAPARRRPCGCSPADRAGCGPPGRRRLDVRRTPRAALARMGMLRMRAACIRGSPRARTSRTTARCRACGARPRKRAPRRSPTCSRCDRCSSDARRASARASA